MQPPKRPSRALPAPSWGNAQAGLLDRRRREAYYAGRGGIYVNCNVPRETSSPKGALRRLPLGPWDVRFGGPHLVQTAEMHAPLDESPGRPQPEPGQVRRRPAPGLAVRRVAHDHGAADPYQPAG